MKAAIYVRVSTEEQNPQLQERELIDHSVSQGYEIVEPIYKDEGWSGSRRDRPALNRLLEDAKLHKFDVVLTWKLDRLARSLYDLLDILKTFENYRIKLTCLHDPIDTTTPQGVFFTQIIGAFAEFEREIIRERVKAGMQHAKRQGKQIGRRKTYTKEQESKIMELASLGEKYTEIAKELNINPGSVKHVLTKAIKLPSQQNGQEMES